MKSNPFYLSFSVARDPVTCNVSSALVSEQPPLLIQKECQNPSLFLLFSPFSFSFFQREGWDLTSGLKMEACALSSSLNLLPLLLSLFACGLLWSAHNYTGHFLLSAWPPPAPYFQYCQGTRVSFLDGLPSRTLHIHTLFSSCFLELSTVSLTT